MNPYFRGHPFKLALYLICTLGFTVTSAYFVYKSHGQSTFYQPTPTVSGGSVLPEPTCTNVYVGCGSP
jgi:hypothetical protein